MTRLVLVQARLQSTRLPEKVLADICGVPMLGRVVQRAQLAACGPVIVATGADPANNRIREWCAGFPVACESPNVPEDDVLGRFLAIADKHGADEIVRLTGDCPLIDPAAIGAVASAMESPTWHYVTSAHPASGWVEGVGDVEGVRVDALREVAEVATREEREHATLWFRTHAHWPRVCCGVVKCGRPSPELVCEFPDGARWGAEHYSVDTAEDLERVRAIYAAARDGIFENEVWRAVA